MKRFIFIALVFAAPPAALHTQEPKKTPFELLRHKDLEKLDGSWELKVETKSGWRGTVDLFITVYGPGGDLDGACRLVYDAMLSKGGNDNITVINSRAPGHVTTAGVKMGNVRALVSRGKQKKDDKPGLTDVNPIPELTVPFQLDGNKLTLDLSKSAAHFLPAKLIPVDLDLAKLQFTRSNKKRNGK